MTRLSAGTSNVVDLKAEARLRVVIVGGGFGGLAAARRLKSAPVELTLIDRSNHHLFQPLLYQVATGALSPANIAAPLRRILRRQRNTRVLLGGVEAVDLAARKVHHEQGALDYDILVVATGARHDYFGHQDWERIAPGLKTIEDATRLRRRILRAFERAELESDPQRRREWLTFVVVGAGPTGVELAGALGEIANDTLPLDFRSIDPTTARILLVEAADQVLPTYPRGLAAKAQRGLERLGVTVWTGCLVAALDADSLAVRRGDRSERVVTRTILWAAGVRASPLGEGLAEQAGVELDRIGRVPVRPDLSLPNHPEVFVIGDLACALGADRKPLPGTAAVAQQQGRYVADLLGKRLEGRRTGPFVYRHKGSMATVGRGFAVADFGRVRLSGYAGWVSWLGVHLMMLTEFENRLLVLVQWAWSYWTRNRSARLIVGDERSDG